MVSENQDDAEGYFLKRVREVVGDEIPVVGTFDLHANLTKAKAKYATCLTGYDTYPHIDGYERGLEAAEIAHKTALRKIKPTMALSKLPFGPPPQRHVTSRLPMSAVYEKAWEMEAMDKVLVVSVAPAFIWSDFDEMGFGVVVTTDNDMALAERLAKELTDWVWERRETFLYEPTSFEEAVNRAIQAPEGPIVLADIYDNPGGGASCDGTVLLKGLLDHNAQNVAVGIIADPEAVAAAIESGIGTEVTLQVGGKTENRVQPWDREVFRINGITPEDKKILVVKSSAHFRADFEPIAKEVIEVGSLGILSSDMSLFDYKKIPRPFYPLDKDKF